jgi:DNA-binding NtrC family response regulator
MNDAFDLQLLRVLDDERQPGPSCLSADLLEEIVDGSVSPLAAREHLAECLACLNEFARLQGLTAPSGPSTPRRPVRGPDSPYIVGDSARMREIQSIINKAGAWDANVCIEGEHGTGKELVAHALYRKGPRSDHPYVTLDCSTIPEGLIESHLFGHVRGAFTGAVSTRQGVFAQAHTGTLFIDGITELAPHLQARLLRVTQTGEFTMVGGLQPQRANVRIITAANGDLHQAVANGTFREDLYHRIAVIRIAIPPLRERRMDIPLLVAHFLHECGAASGGREIRSLTERTMAALMTYAWPGNVRQLKNWIEQAVMLADGGDIDLEHFPWLTRELSETEGAASPPPSGLTLGALERWYVLETLKQAAGDRTRAARELGISLRGLEYKLRSYRTPSQHRESDAQARDDEESSEA